MRVNKELVIQTACDYVDRHGLKELTLKNLAEALSIRTPSLYNHIDSLDHLVLEIAHKGMQQINMNIIEAIIGKSGEDALLVLGETYFQYVILHPGIYESIQWANWHSNEKTRELFSTYLGLIDKLLLSCPTLNEASHKDDHLISSFTNAYASMLHGYVTMNLHIGLHSPTQAIASLTNALKLLLTGMLHTN